MSKYITIILTILVALITSTPSISAQSPCTIIFGGGLKADGSPYCMEAISTTQSSPSNQNEYSQALNGFPSQTKGGLGVQSAPSMQNQPATGPESLALLGMIPAAAFGWYLRRKAA